MNVNSDIGIRPSRVTIWAALCTIAAGTQTLGVAQSSGAPAAVAALQGNSSMSFATTMNSTASAVEAYWNPQRLLRARPIELKAPLGTSARSAAPQVPVDSAPQVRVEGSLPSVMVPASQVKTLIPEFMLQSEATAESGEPQTNPETNIDSDNVPNGTSSRGAYFTTSRVFPDAALTTYPNRTAGKLFFTNPVTGADSMCSASTLRRRIVVTAGHCIASPSTNPSLRHFYTNFLFIPAYRDGVAPLQVWTVRFAWVANAWYLSDGSVPNAMDVGMLVMNDNNGVPIASVTGTLGYVTNALAKNHVTMLGYPGNLDRGAKMQMNHAQTFGPGGNNTFLYGSAMRGGSSGGPWIQDYGVNPSSNPVVSVGKNYVVSVTSYGPNATEPKYQGASNLDSRFIELLNAACGPVTTRNCQ